MKVVNDLVNAGYLESVRGRFGGVRLARPAAEINVGAVVRHTEEGFDLVDCGNCIVAPACGLTGALAEALAAFMRVLDGYSLDDLLQNRRDFAALCGLPEIYLGCKASRGRGISAAPPPVRLCGPGG